MKFEHKKSLGQNFLTSDYVPKKMCDAANITAGDLVLEIGPGTGMLTKELLLRGAKVVAVEADVRAITSLEETFAEEITKKQLTIHHSDARKLDLKKLGCKSGQYKVVANIPYYLSGLLLRAILDTNTQPTTLVFLIQKELATRIARDKKESLLSLSVKVFGNPKYVETIKRGHFNPPPKVDSAILLVEDISRERLGKIDSKDFFDLLHLGFGQKRKQLIHNLSTIYSREHIISVLESESLPSTVRAEDISITNWLSLVTKLCNLKHT